MKSDYMDRRGFLKSLGAGTAAQAILNSPASEAAGLLGGQGRGYRQGQDHLRYPLVSTPDTGTVLDKHAAEKARKVASHVLRISQNGENAIQSRIKKGLPGLYRPDSSDSSLYQDGVAVVRIGKWSYTLVARNADEETISKLPRVTEGYRDLFQDELLIAKVPIPAAGTNNVITIWDIGLNGRIDFGRIPAALSAAGQDIEYRARSKRDPGRGLSEEGRFQGLYLKELENLLRFFEAK